MSITTKFLIVFGAVLFAFVVCGILYAWATAESDPFDELQARLEAEELLGNADSALYVRRRVGEAI